MPTNMLSSPRLICFPMYSIRSQQEANRSFPPSRPPYNRVYSFIICSRSMLLSMGVASAGAREYA